jgi:hypothetical protein
LDSEAFGGERRFLWSWSAWLASDGPGMIGLWDIGSETEVVKLQVMITILSSSDKLDRWYMSLFSAWYRLPLLSLSYVVVKE